MANTPGTAVSVVDTIDSHGGTIKTITAVSLEHDTVSENTLLEGITAHNALGEAIVGTVSGSNFPTALQKTVVLDGELSLEIPVSGEFGVITVIHDDQHPIYRGETTVTPTQETQILTTANNVVLENITINPIPENYGLITWNGAVLTVS